MPEKKTLERARRDKKQGKSASTQAGEFVRQEMDRLKQKGGPRSRKQAIAIGLSEARRSGVKLPPPKRGTASEKTRRKAQRYSAKGQPRSKRQTSKSHSQSRSTKAKKSSHTRSRKR